MSPCSGFVDMMRRRAEFERRLVKVTEIGVVQQCKSGGS